MAQINAKFVTSNTDFKNCPPARYPEFAFIGRSNVGKSSLINSLTFHKGLAKTSQTPGKTQLINHFIIDEKWYLVDLPGYGFAKVSIRSRRRWEQMIEGYLRKRENLVMVFVLIDARHTPQKIDLDFLNQLDKWEIPFTMIFTKADKETQAVVAKNVKLFLDRLRKTWQFLPQHFVSSATKKLGKDKILKLIDETNESNK